MASGIEKIKAKLGPNIRKYRKALTLTQRELSIQADVSEDYIRFLENGRNTPTMAVLGRLADALKIEPHELLK
ncbi:MAG: helix-turn-helix transcriptional regulator [Candidatus Gastranaerophilales bacterium]|nr:helix-turn-helix transcriptional regulator [Candidatus Gastranaerophilales bacterium]